jgi:microcystin-dependent protein
MPVESASHISDLNPTFPLASDPVAQGAAHIRTLKGAIQATFPNVEGAVTGTHQALTAAAALQPNGPGQVEVPAVAVVGSRVRWNGLSGAYSYVARVLANRWTLFIRNEAGPTEVQAVEVDGSGHMAVTGNVVAGGSIFSGNTILVPVGTILMWSGSVASIPAGWSLCDGSNGTPDLRGRFVIGAGGSYAVGASGGASSVALTTTHLPAHTHGVNDPGHTHGVTDPGHTHSVTDPGHSHSGASQQPVSTPGTGIAGTGLGYTFNAAPSATTGVTVNLATAGASVNSGATGITTQSAGSGGSFSVLNPHHALCYIMRVA